MKSKVLGALVAGSALMMMACKDDTGVYSGGTPGAPVQLLVSQSAFTFRQADTSSIGAQLVDSAGNSAAGTVDVASCDPTVVTVAAGTAPAGWNALSTVTASGIGHSCITLTSGSMVDTAVVDVGPYAMTISGPAAGTTNQTYVYHVTAIDPAGAAVAKPFDRTWSSSSGNFTVQSRTGSGDSVLVKSSGTKGSFRVRVSAFGGASAFFGVTIN